MTKDLTDTIDPVKEATQDLLKQCLEGNKEAFRRLYEAYVRSMYNISMRILNNSDEAEDVLQESFMAAFSNLKQFEGKASFGSWLKRIVINNSIDAVKKRKQEVIPLEQAGVIEDDPEYIEEPEYSAETINAALQQLPDGFRVIVTLFLFEDYSHKMIAERLGITESTSKSQYSRGRKKLAALIQQMNQGHAR